jgi:hypothetical protein
LLFVCAAAGVLATAFGIFFTTALATGLAGLETGLRTIPEPVFESAFATTGAFAPATVFSLAIITLKKRI